MADFVFSLLLGFGTGAVFAILAVGVVIAYRGSGVINFAHGAIAMYTALTFNRVRTDPDLGGSGDIFLPWVDIIPEWGWLRALRLNNLPVRITVGDAPMGTLPAAVIALAMAALIGFMAHFFVFRPLRNASPLSKVIGSVGVMSYLVAISVLHFGTRQKADLGWGPFKSSDDPFENFLGLGSNYPRANLWLLVAAVVVTIAAWALIRFTRFGLAARASDENERGMVLLGYSPDFIAGLTWILSAMLAGVVGIIFVAFTQPTNMVLLIVPALGAALIGNLTSIPLAAAGGVAIAMLQSGGVWAAGNDWWPSWAPSNGVRQFVPLLIVIVVLFWRGDRLPVRGSRVDRGQPRAPELKDPKRVLLIGMAFVVFLLSISGWQIESGLTTTLVAGIFMLSLVVLVGFLGQISLAQWSLAGLAGFVTIRLSADGSVIREIDLFVKDGPGFPQPLAALGGVVVAVLAGIVIGLPAVRVRGFQLAVISIAAVIAIEDLLLKNDSIMGAGSTSNNPTPIPEWFGIYLGGQKRTVTDGVATIGSSDNPAYSVLVIVMAVLCSAAVVNLRRGITGRRFLAVRANERAAAAAAIDVGSTKLLGFAIASGLAGIAGVLFVYKLPSVTAQSFGLFAGIALLSFVYIAGITNAVRCVRGRRVGGGWLPRCDHGQRLGECTVPVHAVDRCVRSVGRGADGERRGRVAAGRSSRAVAEAVERSGGRARGVGSGGSDPGVGLGGIALADFVARGVLPIALDDLQGRVRLQRLPGRLPAVRRRGGGCRGGGVRRTVGRSGEPHQVAHRADGDLGGVVGDDRPRGGVRATVRDPDRVGRDDGHRRSGVVLAARRLLPGAVATQGVLVAVGGTDPRWRLRHIGGGYRHRSGRLAVGVPGGFGAGDDPDLPRRPAPGARARCERRRGVVRRVGRGCRCRGGRRRVGGEGALETVSWGEALATIRRVRSLPWLIVASAFSFGPAIGVTFWAPTFLRRHHDLTAGEAAGLFGFAALSGALLGAWVAAKGPERIAQRVPAGGGVRSLALLLPNAYSDDQEKELTPIDDLDPVRLRHIKLAIAGIGSVFGVSLLMLAYSADAGVVEVPVLGVGCGGVGGGGSDLGVVDQ